MAVYYEAVNRDWCENWYFAWAHFLLVRLLCGMCMRVLHREFVNVSVQMWFIQGRCDTEPFWSQVASPTVTADSRWQCQESTPDQATVKPHINLIYLCHGSSPDPATHSLSDKHTKKTSLIWGRHKHMHAHTKIPNLMHTHTQKHTVMDTCKNKYALYLKTSFHIP